jgi:hypothetical protein
MRILKPVSRNRPADHKKLRSRLTGTLLHSSVRPFVIFEIFCADILGDLPNRIFSQKAAKITKV